MKISKIYIFCLAMFFSSNCYANEANAFNTVQRFFSGMSTFSNEKMEASITEDFQILEAGEVWDINHMYKALESVKKVFKERRNFFSIIKIVKTEDTVWISYWNKAAVTPIEGDILNLAWLESVVLSRVNNEWKLQLLHSTRIKAENIPSELEFKEYID